MVLVFAVLYFVFPSIVTWAKTFILSLTQLIRSFVISLTRRHLRIGVKSMRIFITVLFVASLCGVFGLRHSTGRSLRPA